MRSAKNRRRQTARINHLIFVGGFIIVAAVIAAPIYSVRSSSITGQSPLSSKAFPESKGVLHQITSVSTSKPRLTWSSLFQPALPTPVLGQSIATYNNTDCSTPQSDFFLGDTVCAKATGVPSGLLFPDKISWVDPAGFIRQTDTAIADDNAQYKYQLPSDPTTDINGQTVDNRGTWRVNLTKANGAILQSATFTVHQAANPQADVFVQKFQSNANTITPGGNASFTIVVGNGGPDPAAAIQLTDSAPAGATRTGFMQNSGPTCVPAAQDNPPPVPCTMASMTNGDRAEFTITYMIDSGTSPGTYTTSSTASATTPDPNPDNNTSTAQFEVQSGGGGGGTCSLTCPDNITTPANTHQDPNDPNSPSGAIVHFNPPVGSGDCGTINVDHCNDCFFPEGSTVVTATATSDGSCSFTVTVTPAGSSPTITCPSNQTANADSNCQATVNVGTATATGQNVTVVGYRSDGQPMYDCDSFGNCTRRSSDAPFSAGTTTITWYAYSHDIAGPYGDAGTPPNTCDAQGNNCDEESHRTGSATCTQTITVNDVTPPTIAATNSSASADANCQAPVPDYSSTVSDNCACGSNDTSDACQGHPHITYTQTPAAGTLVGLGPHTVHIEANDGSSNNNGAGNTSTKDVTFTVNDTTPPTITCPANISSSTDPGTCSATVNPGTATATDNCDAHPTVTGTRSDNQSLTSPYPKGTTTITWTATDASGNSSSCTQTVTVNDTEAPTMTFNGQTPSMWPPNHNYQTFTPANFISSVHDNCDSLTVNDVYITKATSDEAENAAGSGNTLNDIVIAANCKSVQLRAERINTGNGRVYTIYFKLKDSSGNFTTGTAKVYAPKNQGGTPVDDGPHYTVTSSCP